MKYYPNKIVLTLPQVVLKPYVWTYMTMRVKFLTRFQRVFSLPGGGNDDGGHPR